MTEQERNTAFQELVLWRHSDATVGELVTAVVRAEGQQTLRTLRVSQPEVFDDLYEEAKALRENDL